MTAPQPKRQIRSFVRREGRITRSQERALRELLPVYGLDSRPAVRSWRRETENGRPLYLEIGFGMGDSLVRSARDNPQILFLGIEVYRPGVGSLLIKLRREGIDNVRVMHGDAIEILHRDLGDHCLDRVLLLFPDPWPKKRHHKRRIVQAEFLDLLRRRIKAGGIFHVATDWAPYREWIDERVCAS